MTPPAATKPSKTFYPRLLAGLGGFLAAALSLGLSLYDARTAGEIEQGAIDAPIDTGRWSITLHAASLAESALDGFQIEKGNKALVVDATFENLSGETSNIFRKSLVLKNITDVPEPQFYLVRDRSILWDLQPMMPEAVKVVWQLPKAQAVPDVLRVDLTGETFKPMDNLYAQPGWFPQEKDVAWIPLPVARTKTGVDPEETP